MFLGSRGELRSRTGQPRGRVQVYTHKARVLIETGFHKFFEGLAVVPLQGGRVVFWDQEENSHGMKV